MSLCRCSEGYIPCSYRKTLSAADLLMLEGFETLKELALAGQLHVREIKQHLRADDPSDSQARKLIRRYWRTPPTVTRFKNFQTERAQGFDGIYGCLRKSRRGPRLDILCVDRRKTQSFIFMACIQPRKIHSPENRVWCMGQPYSNIQTDIWIQTGKMCFCLSRKFTSSICTVVDLEKFVRFRRGLVVNRT